MNLPPGIEALPNGQWIVAGDTHLGAWSKEHGNIITDPWLFKWLKPHLEGVNVVWDLGANIGDHARQYVDWDMKVVAFEPNPPTFLCLRHNVPEAECFNIAASDEKAMLRFSQLYNVGASRVSEHGEIEVPAYPLDGFLNYRADILPGFVKIDVEGHEVRAIRGMRKTIALSKPIILCEFNVGALAEQGESPEGLRELIESLGYHAAEVYPPNSNWMCPQVDLLFLPDK